MAVTEEPELVDRATGEIVRHVGGGPLARRQSPAELAVQAGEIREMMRAVLVEGTDYGQIPGTNKPSLFKSGAEWLLKWAGYGHRLAPVEVERDDEGRKVGTTYRCTVFVLGDESTVVSTCDGYAGYEEDRFFQSREALEAKERANASRYQRPARPEKWAEEYRAPWNSVLKMAEKRAMVGATLQATATSGLFTQDMEDHAPAVSEDAPFIEKGWGSKADHDAARAALVDHLRNDLTDEVKAALKEWMAEEGYGLNGSNPPEVLMAIRTKAADMSGTEEFSEFSGEPFDEPTTGDVVTAEAPDKSQEAPDGHQAAQQSAAPPEAPEPEPGPESAVEAALAGSTTGDALQETIEAVQAMAEDDVAAALAERHLNGGDQPRRVLAGALFHERGTAQPDAAQADAALPTPEQVGEMSSDLLVEWLTTLGLPSTGKDSTRRTRLLQHLVEREKSLL